MTADVDDCRLSDFSRSSSGNLILPTFVVDGDSGRPSSGKREKGHRSPGSTSGARAGVPERGETARSWPGSNL
jgi:hypothetical protein